MLLFGCFNGLYMTWNVRKISLEIMVIDYGRRRNEVVATLLLCVHKFVPMIYLLDN